MDPITHGLIGASASQSFTNKKKIRLAALVGAAGAMAPDLDVLIGTSSDPLMTLEYHRQFTHAMLFLPAGALIVAGLLWWLVRTTLSFKETYLFSIIGMATAGLADIFTSYGVQLFWPFTDDRFAWNLVSVFDPLFSLGILIPLGFAIYKRNRGTGYLAIIWIIVYLLFAITQRQKAKLVALQLAQQRNHFIEQLIVKPTIGNQLVWSTRYVSGDKIYADGVRLVPFTDPAIYRGKSARLISWRNKYEDIQGTTLYDDIRRFSVLSNGILVAHPEHTNVIGDGRYAMLPTSVVPLWGIVADTTKLNQHVEFRTYRDAGPDIRNTFINMLTGANVN